MSSVVSLCNCPRMWAIIPLYAAHYTVVQTSTLLIQKKRMSTSPLLWIGMCVAGYKSCNERRSHWRSMQTFTLWTICKLYDATISFYGHELVLLSGNVRVFIKEERDPRKKRKGVFQLKTTWVLFMAVTVRTGHIFSSFFFFHFLDAFFKEFQNQHLKMFPRYGALFNKGTWRGGFCWLLCQSRNEIGFNSRKKNISWTAWASHFHRMLRSGPSVLHSFSRKATGPRGSNDVVTPTKGVPTTFRLDYYEINTYRGRKRKRWRAYSLIGTNDNSFSSFLSFYFLLPGIPAATA